jgi:hypothetical protein
MQQIRVIATYEHACSGCTPAFEQRRSMRATVVAWKR